MVEFASHQVDANTLQLQVSGDLTIYSAAESKSALFEALYAGRNLELDLSGVEQMDSAGFQLLLLLKRESLQSPHSLSITGHSEAVGNIVLFYNMDNYLGLSVVLPAASH